MSQLAALASINGVPVSPPYTYGNAPNNPLTWDAERMFGCHCDAEWTGFDCSLRLCPLGADPTQLMPEDEQQIITCTNNGTAGAVVFSFRGSQVSGCDRGITAVHRTTIHTYTHTALTAHCYPYIYIIYICVCVCVFVCVCVCLCVCVCVCVFV